MTTNTIHNLEHFRNCFCNKESGDRVVELLEFSHEKMGVAHVFRQEIMFVVRGGIHVALEGLGMGLRLKRGDFVFLPAGARLGCDVLRDTALLLVRIPSDVPQCPVFRLGRGSSGFSSRAGSSSGSGSLSESEHSSGPGSSSSGVSFSHDPVDASGIFALKMNKRVRSFVSELVETIEDGFLCRHYLQGEANRLLFLLNAYYPAEDRSRFFSHIVTPDIKFSEFVRANYMKYRTIAELSDVLCMTTQAFSNRFKKVFGTTPHKWILQEKARMIYLDICRNEMPLKEIALKYDFPLSSNFFRFCKQTFGESPGSIRKSLRRNQPIIDN